MEEPETGISQAVHLDLQQELRGAPTPGSCHTLQLSLGTSRRCSTSSTSPSPSRKCSTSSSSPSRKCTSPSPSRKCTTSSSSSPSRKCTTSSPSRRCTTSSSSSRRCTTSSSSSRRCSTSSSSSRRCTSCPQDQQRACKLCRPEKEVLLTASSELRLSRRRTKSLPCLHDPSHFLGGDLGGGGCLRKKVKFADSLGLRLASVKHFRASDQPRVPSKVLLRLQNVPTMVDQLSEQFQALGLHGLRPAFPMPGETSDFLQRAERDRVCLEKVTVSHLDVRGLIRVLNLSYAKEVTVRYTFNNWLSCLDTPAHYVQGSSLSGTDQFSFALSIPPFLDQGSFIHFAICYKAGNQEYWDNNFDKNYALRCEATSDEPANT